MDTVQEYLVKVHYSGVFEFRVCGEEEACDDLIAKILLDQEDKPGYTTKFDLSDIEAWAV